MTAAHKKKRLLNNMDMDNEKTSRKMKRHFNKSERQNTKKSIRNIDKDLNDWYDYLDDLKLEDALYCHKYGPCDRCKKAEDI